MYDWITIMRYSEHELSTINMLYSLKKIIIPLTLHNNHLSTKATLFCPQGDRYGKVWL